MGKDKVDIIVPCYNSEKSIEKCVRSLMRQTYRNIKIILINDGSTDKTLNIISELSKIDKRIKIKTIQNQGVSNARNIGIDISDSKYICFVDSDDYVNKNYIFDLMDKKEFDLVISGYVRKTPHNTIPIKGNNFEILKLDELGNEFGQAYQKAFFNAPWGKLYHRSIIEKNHICFDINKNFGEDAEFNYEYLMHVSSIASIEKINYFYLWMSNDNLTSKFSSTKILQHEKLYTIYKHFVQKKRLDNKYNVLALEKQYLKDAVLY